MRPSKETYDQLIGAYEYFNKTLFAGTLPPCLLILHRKKGAAGYFWGDTWQERTGVRRMDEISLNPEVFKRRTTRQILSTLVHEMCHLQQHHFGKPSRNGYHNSEWAKMMEAVGLIPTDTGEAGGKKTGQAVTHIIEEEGAFDRACTQLLESGFTLGWQAMTGEKKEKIRRKKAASKTKYHCPSCSLNAWAKPDVRLLCGTCLEPMTASEIG